jgi:hypothetical protein
MLSNKYREIDSKVVEAIYDTVVYYASVPRFSGTNLIDKEGDLE